MHEFAAAAAEFFGWHACLAVPRLLLNVIHLRTDVYPLAPAASNLHAKIDAVTPLTLPRLRLYSDYMHAENTREMLEQELKRLESRVAELVTLGNRLRGDNHSLRERLEALSAERAGLLAKNEQVRGHVEAMILRLKSLEESA